MHRRHFLLSTLAAGTGAALAPMTLARPRQGAEAVPRLRILVLGGTAFLGPEFVEAALAHGHEITLFNRGRTRAELFPALEKLRGDRDPDKGEGLRALEGERTWDVVVDNSGYYPRHVKASATLLAPRVRQYLYVSSISAFKEGAPPGSDESWPSATLEDPTVESMGDQFQHYGGLKALCEAAAEAAMPGRVANIRPGFIVGPGDWTGRFSYWPLRARAGGEMLGPGAPADPIQWIDVRDLAAWMVACAERNTTGVFLATGPEQPGTIGGIIEESIRVARARAPAGETPPDTTVTWVPAAFLAEQKLGPGGDLPIWIPPEGEMAGFHRWDNAKARQAGLAFRPLAETIEGILAWTDGLSDEDRARVRKVGLSREREAEVLRAWHQRASRAPGS